MTTLNETTVTGDLFVEGKIYENNKEIGTNINIFNGNYVAGINNRYFKGYIANRYFTIVCDFTINPNVSFSSYTGLGTIDVPANVITHLEKGNIASTYYIRTNANDYSDIIDNGSLFLVVNDDNIVLFTGTAIAESTKTSEIRIAFTFIL